jgi:hypothetical protein
MATMVGTVELGRHEVSGTASAAAEVVVSRAKNILLFFAAPFIGLAYIIAFPFVGVAAVVRMVLR